ncbi:hypothetical protein GWK47_037252 [Chionoecetes opilio]|uniref:Uncharacterized protein n=1 Tax=Chionoecetes opilio TaxID=41210 RepID=A0A8J5CYR6_CHIOP|nr:hypothetical protein GWK47_037252 [Chionoecetes opilio]
MCLLLTLQLNSFGAFPSWFSCMNISRHNLPALLQAHFTSSLTAFVPQAASSRQEPRTLFLHPVSNRSLQQLVSVVGPGDRLSRCQPGTLHAWCAAAGPVELGECSPSFCFSGRTVPSCFFHRHQRAGLVILNDCETFQHLELLASTVIWGMWMFYDEVEGICDFGIGTPCFPNRDFFPFPKKKGKSYHTLEAVEHG